MWGGGGGFVDVTAFNGAGYGAAAHGGHSDWKCNVCNFTNSSFLPYCETCGCNKGQVIVEPAAKAGAETSATALVRGLITGNAQAPQHAAALAKHRDEYLTELGRVLDNGVALTPATKARILVAAWVTKNRGIFDELLATPGFVTVAELVKAMQLLDAGRLVRQQRKRLTTLEASATAVRPGKLARLRADIANAEQEVLTGGSVTSSFAKRVRRWVSSLPADRLEFFLLMYPTEPWAAIADLAHTSPKDFACKYFQACVFGAEPPADSVVAAARAAKAEDLLTLLHTFPVAGTFYSFLHKQFDPRTEWSPAAKAAMARVAPLEDVLYWYHELHCPEAEAVVSQRLVEAEEIEGLRNHSNFGKLMERLLTFLDMKVGFAKLLLPYCQKRLDAVKLPRTDLKIAILGDASGSMEVAIRSAAILGALLSVSLKAELLFFNDRVVKPCVAEPKTAEDVLKVASGTPARRRTSPAAALRPFYENAKKVDLFVMVTDEEENTPAAGMSFAQMFKAYRKDVHAGAKVFFVSFLPAQIARGRMQADLLQLGIECKAFKFDPRRPDLTKFDSLMGLLTMEANQFDTRIGASASTKKAVAAYNASTDTGRRLLDIAQGRSAPATLASENPEETPDTTSTGGSGDGTTSHAGGAGGGAGAGAGAGAASGSTAGRRRRTAPQPPKPKPAQTTATSNNQADNEDTPGATAPTAPALPVPEAGGAATVTTATTTVVDEAAALRAEVARLKAERDAWRQAAVAGAAEPRAAPQ